MRERLDSQRTEKNCASVVTCERNGEDHRNNIFVCSNKWVEWKVILKNFCRQDTWSVRFRCWSRVPGRKLSNYSRFVNCDTFLVSTSRSANKNAPLTCCYCNLFSPAASAIALPIDYDGDDVAGNLINDKDVIAYLQSNDINDFQSAQNAANEADKRDPEMYVGSQKRNIISALRAKMRRSKVEDEGDKMRFSPVLSVGKNCVVNVLTCEVSCFFIAFPRKTVSLLCSKKIPRKACFHIFKMVTTA